MPPEPCFQINAHGDAASYDPNANMGGSIAANARPSIVTLESGVQAIIKIAGFTYVDGVPLAIAGEFAKDVDASNFVERCADGVKLKLKA